MTVSLGGTVILGDQPDPELVAVLEEKSLQIAQLLFSVDQSIRHNLIGSAIMTWALGEPDPAWSLLRIMSSVTEALPEAAAQASDTIQAARSTKQ